MSRSSRCLATLLLWVASLEPAATIRGAQRPAADRPNFIILLCDNLGYGDTEPFGSQMNRTPHLNRMAREGRVFTDFYSTAGVCTPSRASLMTGCYPRRVNMQVSDKSESVLWPVSAKGLHPDEVTVAEVL